jgi:hypothetical protein
LLVAVGVLGGSFLLRLGLGVLGFKYVLFVLGSFFHTPKSAIRNIFTPLLIMTLSEQFLDIGVIGADISPVFMTI